MEKEATKFFEMLLNNSADILKELRLQVYKLLDLDGKTILPNKLDNEKLLEQIQDSIENFNFNLKETQFLDLIQKNIKEELQKVATNRNYESFSNGLLQRLRGVNKLEISLENDFKDLSSRIASSYHTQEDYYNYFIARSEKIVNMLNSYNKEIVSTLVSLTPKLIEELKLENEKRATEPTSVFVNQSNETPIVLTDLKKTTEQTLLEKAIDMCQRRKIELDDMFRNPNYNSDKSTIANASRQLATLIEELSNGTYTGQLSEISDIAIESFITHKIPSLEEINKLKSIESESFSFNNLETTKQDAAISGKEYEEQYLKKKEELINTWINSTTMDFANKIYRTYPYSYADADVSSYKEHFKSIYNIPRYPISDEEWDMIIEQINKKLYNIVDMLIKEDQLKRGGTMPQAQEQTEKRSEEQTIGTVSNVEKVEANTNPINNPQFEGKLDEDLSMMISSEIKMDIVFDLTEKYNQGMPFIPITTNDLMSKYNMNEKIAQKLATEVNTMVKDYIANKEQAKTNYQPFVLESSYDEENKGMHR